MKTVAVLGGGPAGSFAAERLAQAGMKVLLFDEKLARFFPCELLVEQQHFHAGLGEALGGERSGGSAAQNSNGLHCLDPMGGCPGGSALAGRSPPGGTCG